MFHRETTGLHCCIQCTCIHVLYISLSSEDIINTWLVWHYTDCVIQSDLCPKKTHKYNPSSVEVGINFTCYFICYTCTRIFYRVTLFYVLNTVDVRVIPNSLTRSWYGHFTEGVIQSLGPLSSMITMPRTQKATQLQFTIYLSIHFNNECYK